MAIKIHAVLIRIALLIALTLLLVPSSMAGETTYGTVTVKSINSVYDGDTFRCDVEGWPPILGDNISIRVNGIDTPEMKDKRPHVKALAIKARDHVRQRLRGASVIELRNIQRGKYFRVVADVYVDEVNLGEELIFLGLAYEYHGDRKQDWGLLTQ